MGIPVRGKALFPVTGELSTQLVLEGASGAGLIRHEAKKAVAVPDLPGDLPARPPLLCPGCPHRGPAYVLSELGFGPGELSGKSEARRHIATSDIGCYTLMVYPPLSAIDSCVCMGGSIGMAHGLEKAGVAEKVVAILGDSTFMHAGIPALVNMFYNRSQSTVIVLDNRTTAMTGHQGHPASGRSARNEEAPMVDIANLARGIGVNDVNVVSAFDLKELEATLRRCTENEETSVVVVTGDCPLFQRAGGAPFRVDAERCSGCELCLSLGCPAITFAEEQASILVSCVGESCGLCLQLCPSEAIEKAGA